MLTYRSMLSYLLLLLPLPLRLLIGQMLRLQLIIPNTVQAHMLPITIRECLPRRQRPPSSLHSGQPHQVGASGNMYLLSICAIQLSVILAMDQIGIIAFPVSTLGDQFKADNVNVTPGS
jgi:hypothetical protein